MKLKLLPRYAEVEIIKPGGRVGKGGNPHHYLVNGAKYRRVTTILDQTIPKPGLIFWAKNVALEKCRDTLLEHRLASGPSETAWPIYVADTIEAARNRPDEVKGEAADWGTGAHKAIQSVIDDLLGGPVGRYAPEYDPTVTAFRHFQIEQQIAWLATEMTVWDDYTEVAGTVDAVGRNAEGKLVVFDWKTGKGLYPEHALQVSAYASMLGKLVGEEVAGAYVVRFPREQPDDGPPFEVKEIDNIKWGWDQYRQLVWTSQYLKAKVWKEAQIQQPPSVTVLRPEEKRRRPMNDKS